MRTTIAIVLVLHGLIHLMGFAKAFGLAELPQLTHPISKPMALLWLLAAVLLVAAATALFALPPWWWVAGILAIVISQAVIITSWNDAKYGTIAKCHPARGGRARVSVPGAVEFPRGVRSHR